VVVRRGRIFLYALREIAPGEEITTDYLYELGLEGTRCNCRLTSCQETMGPGGDHKGDRGAGDPRRPISHPTLLWGGACEG
jgi:hypothetical protein